VYAPCSIARIRAPELGASWCAPYGIFLPPRAWDPRRDNAQMLEYRGYIGIVEADDGSSPVSRVFAM
jgi:hypothetical protein